MTCNCPGDQDSIVPAHTREFLSCCVVLWIDRQRTAPFACGKIILTFGSINASEVITRFSIMKTLNLQRRQQSFLSFIPLARSQQQDSEVVVGSRVQAFALLDRSSICGDGRIRLAETGKRVAEIVETNWID